MMIILVSMFLRNSEKIVFIVKDKYIYYSI